MKLILEHFTNLNKKQIEQFSMLKAIYENWNQKINVISRKDIDNINLRHVLHSMSIAKFIKFNEHKKIAKITFPLWLYVAITGVIVYLMISPYYA